jgi:hypothetical protein
VIDWIIVQLWPVLLVPPLALLALGLELHDRWKGRK